MMQKQIYFSYALIECLYLPGEVTEIREFQSRGSLALARETLLATPAIHPKAIFCHNRNTQ